MRIYLVTQPYHDGGRTIRHKILGVVVAADEAAARDAVPAAAPHKELPYYDEVRFRDLGHAFPIGPDDRGFRAVPGRFA